MKLFLPSSGSSFSSFIFSTSIIASFCIVKIISPGSDLKLHKQRLETHRIKTRPEKSIEALTLVINRRTSGCNYLFSETSFPKYQKFPSQINIFGTSCKRPPLVTTQLREGYTRFQCYVHRRHLRLSFDMPSFDMLFERLFNCERAIFHGISGRNERVRCVNILMWARLHSMSKDERRCRLCM